MEHKPTYIPKSGDEVSSSKHSGRFIVHSVDKDNHTVDVRLIGPSNAVTFAGVPWETLKPLNREDFSQAAARIVKEATKD